MWFNNFSQALGEDNPGTIEEDGREVADKGRGYVFTPELVAAIDVAIGLGRPLLVSGEPGCGKTELGYAVARHMRIRRVHSFSTKSNSEARDLFYNYDALSRFRDANSSGDGPDTGYDVADYIEFRALGRAILDSHPRDAVAHLLRGRRAYQHPGEPERSVVIIDEVDKASRDFPNDLLREIEDLAFRVPELGRHGAANESEAEPVTPGAIDPAVRPIIIVTSNEERQLPDAFLRRCVFHQIGFPSPDLLARIIAGGIDKRLPDRGAGFALPVADRDLLTDLLKKYRDMRLDKRPGISEAIDAAALLAYPDSPEPPGVWDRVRAAMPALAKLRSDRDQLKTLIDGLAPPTVT
ncbi:MAG: hypothetical protein JWR51_3440 [Devosia sp.]|uniref:AAA family ATPase n=1 Tax=Devosia sp. TaxID=1871048 RepID=UPI002632502D|nr:MoxR family ATPase [Devosia sp.]MDB5530337.1 hypothetical protein [Devosia sp.]